METARRDLVGWRCHVGQVIMVWAEVAGWQSANPFVRIAADGFGKGAILLGVV